MKSFKTNYPKRFVIFSILYFISFSIFIGVNGFKPVNLGIKLLIVTVLFIYFNYIDLRISKGFRLSFNLPVMFYIFFLYPPRFIIPYSFILLFIIFFVKKVIRTKNWADAFIIAFFTSSLWESYVLIGVFVFRSIFPNQFLHIGVIQGIAIVSAYFLMTFFDFISFWFTNNILLKNRFSKKDIVVGLYASLSDLILLLLFLPLYIMTANNMNTMALFYIVSIYVLIRIFYKILSVRLDILVYADLLKKLNNLKYDIDDYQSIEKSVTEYLEYIKPNIMLENIYYYRKTNEDILEITPDDKKIFKYLLPEIHAKIKKHTTFSEIKKGEIKHFSFRIMYFSKFDTKEEISGMLVSLIENKTSPYLLNYLKIVFNRFNAILDLHLDSEESRNLLKSIISILVSTIEGSSKDAVTHSKRVAIIASSIAEKLGYPKGKTDLFKYAGLLHDIGIVSYSRSIYAKKNQNELTDKEWNMIRNHPIVGYNVLKNIKSLGDVPLWILEHHERYDGTGFPNGKKGKEISEGGMILNLANVFDSFLFGKPYMKKVPVSMAVKYIIKGKGTLFDPDLIDKVQLYLEEIANKSIKNTEY
ncbi:MAG: HD domain-containing protein [Proteobacteria bacterium]|nr:HD domain-containing protein [Pseudomonadota bacterium]